MDLVQIGERSQLQVFAIKLHCIPSSFLSVVNRFVVQLLPGWDSLEFQP